ncbi:MAG: FimV/HubP family polar landmark protein [Mariprofundaceae bacterium]|nr:FimV/HubP family polar landmark protein [Mariprofundaceae bacterium]
MKYTVYARLKPTVWLASLVFMIPYTAQAFSFGVPVIQSHLNEPLKVRVPIALDQGEVLNHIFIDLAKPDVYQQWGLQIDMKLSQLHLAIHQEKKAYPYVEIFSYEPINRALVSFILLAKKNQHHFYKQVKVLLDPLSPSSSNKYTQHEDVIRLQAKKQLNVSQPPVKKKAKPIRVNEKGWARLWNYGPVRYGDSLSTIAYRLRKDRRYSNHAVMLALYRLNPEAFEQGDINHLKAGVFLKVPHAKELHVLLSESATSNKPKLTPTNTPQKKKQADQQTVSRFVGHISAKIDDNPVATVKKNQLEKDVSTVQKRLDSMYQTNMASHIRMDGMDVMFNKVHEKIDDMGKQLKKINQDELALQVQVDQLSDQYDDPWMWRWGLLLLLLLNASGLAFVYLHFRKKHIPSSDSPDILHPSQEIEKIPHPLATVNHQSIDNHIYDLERALDHQDYSLAETILNKMDDKQANNTRLLALKVRLYHETGRTDERDACVHQSHTDLNESQWRVFCDHLPSSLWQALVAAHVVSGLSYEDDMEERVRDIDDTVIRHIPHPIVDKEESTRQFEHIEDIGFEGIPITSDEAMMDEKPSEQSFDSLGGPLLPDTYDTPLAMSEEEPVLDAMSDMPFTIDDNDDTDIAASHLSLDNDIENMTSEYIDFQDEFKSPVEIVDEVPEKKTEVDDPFTFEFDDSPIFTASEDLLEKEMVTSSDEGLIEDDGLFFQSNNEQEEASQEKT